MSGMSFDEKHKVVQGLFSHVFEGYVVKDIDNLLTIRPDEEGYGGCAAPLAMTCFATMNRLGFLTTETEKKLKLSDTDTCIEEFCKDWMKKVNAIYGRSTLQKLLIRVFRHGLAHQFLSSGGSAITRNPKFERVINELDDGTYVLQSEILARDLISGIGKLGESLRDQNKRALIERYYQRWLTQESTDLKNLKKAYRRSKKKRKNQLLIPLVKMADFDVTISGQPMPPTGTLRYTTTTISGTNLATTITV